MFTDIVSIHIFNLILALVVLGFGTLILIKDELTKFETTLIIFFMALQLNAAIYCTIFLIDWLDGILISNALYNWWNSFIRFQSLISTILVLYIIYKNIIRRKKIINRICEDLSSEDDTLVCGEGREDDN